MNDELQTDVSEDITTESQEEVTTPIEAESATAEQEVVKEKVTFSDEQQEILNGITADKTKKFREAERRAEAAEQKLREAEAKIPQAQAPTVPDMPDPLSDDDYEEKVVARDEAIRARASYDYQQQANQAQQQQAYQDAQTQHQQTQQARIDGFIGNAKKQGIAVSDLDRSIGTLVEHNLDPQLIGSITDEVNGPQVAIFLDKNPHLIESLKTANQLTIGGVYNDLVAKAGAASKKTVAPAPHESLSGAGAPAKQRGPKGATFE